ITTITVSRLLVSVHGQDLSFYPAGFSRDYTAEFNHMRRKTVDRAYLEVTRLEKRLTKLTQLLTNQWLDQNTGSNSKLWSINGARSQRKQLEQTVVTWEDDTSVTQCPFCKQEFSNYSLRRHQCRLCGRVVCGDLRTGCSSEVGLNVAASEPITMHNDCIALN